MMIKCDFLEATYVSPISWQPLQKIVGKWGILEGNRLAPPSEGGFGCVTKDGQQIDMWNAAGYYRIGPGEHDTSSWQGPL